MDEDGSLIKKVLCIGTGACAGEASHVRLLVDAVPFQFQIGMGDVCDALEFAALGMKVGERALLTSHRPAQYCQPELGPQVHKEGEQLALTLELASCEGGNVSATAPLEERLAFATTRKGVGGGHFKDQRYALALGRYNQILALFGATDKSDAVRELQRTCELNSAACLLKMGHPARAQSACDRVLIVDPDHVKALYRRASAHYDLSDYGAALTDLKKILQIDANNADARQLFTKVTETRKRYAKDAKTAATRMILPADQQPPVEESVPVQSEGTNKPATRPPLRPWAGILGCLPLPCGRERT